MTYGERLLWASAILFADFVIYVLPLSAFLLVYVIFMKPEWFRDWVLRVYSE